MGNTATKRSKQREKEIIGEWKYMKNHIKSFLLIGNDSTMTLETMQSIQMSHGYYLNDGKIQLMQYKINIFSFNHKHMGLSGSLHSMFANSYISNYKHFNIVMNNIKCKSVEELDYDKPHYKSFESIKHLLVNGFCREIVNKSYIKSLVSLIIAFTPNPTIEVIHYLYSTRKEIFIQLWLSNLIDKYLLPQLFPYVTGIIYFIDISNYHKSMNTFKYFLNKYAKLSTDQQPLIYVFLNHTSKLTECESSDAIQKKFTDILLTYLPEKIQKQSRNLVVLGDGKLETTQEKVSGILYEIWDYLSSDDLV
eukprot:398278_1